DAFCAELKHRRTLIVLDNCEHMLAACAALSKRLLETCPFLRILATSREPLGVAGETVRLVKGLEVPRGRGVNDPELLAEYEALQLLLEPSSAVTPDFSLTRANARAVDEICRCLDGIPLALELAAAQTRLLSVAQIAERVGQALPLLAAPSRTQPR